MKTSFMKVVEKAALPSLINHDVTTHDIWLMNGKKRLLHGLCIYSVCLVTLLKANLKLKKTTNKHQNSEFLIEQKTKENLTSWKTLVVKHP